MYFLFTIVLAASFLLCAEFTAVTFAPALLLTAVYMYLFSRYFASHRRTAVFVPLVLLSVSVHIAFFLIEMRKDYVKDVSIWVLAFILVAVCFLIAFGSRSISGITAFTNMSVPVFFTVLIIMLISIVTGNVTVAPVVGNNIYQYLILVVSPPSTALSLFYMHRCRFIRTYPAFVSAIVLTVCLFLFDSPFFKAVALNLMAPFVISAEMLLLKETVFPSKESIEKNKEMEVIKKAASE